MANTTLIEHYNQIINNIDLLLYKLNAHDYEGFPNLLDSIILHLSRDEKESVLTKNLSVMIGDKGAYRLLEEELKKISERFKLIREHYSKD